MESKYNYFKRDISWLSFNYRVLLEALDERLPLYEKYADVTIDCTGSPEHNADQIVKAVAGN